MVKLTSKHPLTLYQAVGKNTKPVLFEQQLIYILQRTPKDHIYQRPGKGGANWDYVTGAYVKKVLNYVFAWNWDFEVKSKEEKYGQIVVEGRLTVRTKSGVSIVKEQFGRADIKYKKNTQTPLDYGNDLKAASTDALKKCASELGIASDVYAKEEFKQLDLQKEEAEKEKKLEPANATDSATNEQIETIEKLDAKKNYAHVYAKDEMGNLKIKINKSEAQEIIKNLATQQ